MSYCEKCGWLKVLHENGCPEENGFQYYAYTDGTSKPNPGDGGWGLVVVNDVGVRTYHGGKRDTTNNEMELIAVLEAVRSLPEGSKVKVITDSRLVEGFLAKNFKCKAENLLPILMEIKMTIMNKRIDFSIEWTKGHKKKDRTIHSEFNEMADDLALMGYQETVNA